MKIIKEEKTGKESTFNVTERINEVVISSKDVRITSVVVQNRGLKRHLLYNSNLRLFQTLMNS
jgi:hypothetical protein